MSLKLSVLDQSVAMSGRGQDESIRQTLALAQSAERLGYSRFWVSEHHAHPSIVGTAPEILMAAIATQTQRIRIGSAGVMLPHYASLKVAEQFRVLDALAPGRIDLGVGRAPGSDGKTAQLLNPDRYASENFPQQVMELQAWVKGQPLPVGHPGHGVFAYPQCLCLVHYRWPRCRAGLANVQRNFQAKRSIGQASCNLVPVGIGRRHRRRSLAFVQEPRALAYGPQHGPHWAHVAARPSRSSVFSRRANGT